MENKEITFYLDQNSYSQLKSDQISFHLNNNESVLIKRIIVNFYPKYSKEKLALENKIIDSIESQMNDLDTKNISWKIIKYLGEASITKSDNSSKKSHKDKLHFRINKNEDALESIIDSCPPCASTSEFIANIIYSYLDKPLHIREQIVFKDVYEDLKSALKNNQQVKIKSKSNARDNYEFKVIEPKELCASKEELYNYLLYKCIRDEKECASSIHLYNIISAVAEPKTCDFDDNINSYFKRMKKNGVQFSISDNIIYKLKLSKHGIELYENNLKYIEKPVALENSDKEKGIYYFDCSKMQLENYFGSFYDDVEILEPKEYRKEFYKKIKNQMNKYK